MPISETYGCADAMVADETFACADAMVADETFACAGAVDGLGPPGTPTGLAVDSVTTTSATLSWDAVSGATSYDLRYSLVDQNDWTEVEDVSSPAEITGLTADTEYDFQIRAANSAGASDWSASVQGTTEAAYEAETLAFQTRVLADGGTVGDLDFVDALLSTLKDMGRYDDLRLLAGPELAYKDDSSAIGTLYDASGEENDLTQATTSQKPTLIEVGDRLYAATDGTDDYLGTVLAQAWPFTILVAFRYISGNCVYSTHASANNGRMDVSTSNGYSLLFGGTAGTRYQYGSVDSNLHLHVAHIGDSYGARLDGVDQGAGTNGGVGTPDQNITLVDLGRERQRGRNVEAEFALFAVLAGEVSEGEAAALEALIADHFGISL